MSIPQDQIDRLYRALSDPNALRRLVATENVFELSSALPNPVLHLAAADGNVEVLRILLEAGGRAHINAFDDLGWTPLVYAARGEHLDAVKFLLEHDADVNAHDERRAGNTVLREVIDKASVPLVEMLVKHGADPRIPGWMQLTATDKARERYGRSLVPDSQRILEIVQSVK